MEKIIFFGLVIPIFLFVLYLGGRAIMTGFSAKSSNKSDSEIEVNNNVDNSENLTEESEAVDYSSKAVSNTMDRYLQTMTRVAKK